MSREIEVTLVQARYLKNEDGMFGKNDPYVILKAGGKKQKSSTKSKAGSKAEWNEVFRLPSSANDELQLDVYDKDMLSDDLIGKTSIPMKGIFETNGLHEQWYQIGKGSEPCGQVLLRIRVVY